MFLQPGSIKVKRERRTGAWADINRLESDEPFERHYVTIRQAHGPAPDGEGYAYAVLPNQTARETGKYASNPDVTVLVNSPEVTAVKERKLGIVAAAFWKEGRHSAGIIACDAPAAVMMCIQDNQLTVSIADPTHPDNGSMELELAIEAVSILSSDDRIGVKQLSPSVILSVDAGGSQGAAMEAMFIVRP